MAKTWQLDLPLCSNNQVYSYHVYLKPATRYACLSALIICYMIDFSTLITHTQAHRNSSYHETGSLKPETGFQVG